MSYGIEFFDCGVCPDGALSIFTADRSKIEDQLRDGHRLLCSDCSETVAPVRDDPEKVLLALAGRAARWPATAGR